MIITVPHPTLRKKALKVEKVTPELVQIIELLGQDLTVQRKPRGVGLAAPQIDHSLSMFATLLAPNDDDELKPELRVFINPEIVTTSPGKTFGPDIKQPILEGCLSIPHIYGPVPRFEWIELEYDELVDGKLMRRKERFDQFVARVVQHEFDHLHGVLFTDYSLEFDLPIYDDTTGKMVLIDKKGISW